MYEAELHELGLTENESKVYLALLQHGCMNPTTLAQTIGMHRSYLYDTLERLLERGFISTLLMNGKKHFQAQDPKILRESVEVTLRRVDQIIPQLNKLFLEQRKETSIELHRGKRVYRTLIKDIISHIDENDEVLLIGVDETILDTVEPIYIKQYFSIIKEKHVTERILIAKGGKQIHDECLNYRELEADFFGKTTTAIFQDKVYLFLWSEPQHLIVIDSAEGADSYRRQFEHLWRLATP
ncbi:MAG: helix-turn-helix domain-containing protein [Nanoarchaeota archaeon]